jgi:hypothetical protein
LYANADLPPGDPPCPAMSPEKSRPTVEDVFDQQHFLFVGASPGRLGWGKAKLKRRITHYFAKTAFSEVRQEDLKYHSFGGYRMIPAVLYGRHSHPTLMAFRGRALSRTRADAAGSPTSPRFRPLALLAAQVGQHGQHAAVVGLALGEAQLAEDAFYVLLHRPAGDEERLRYGPVGAPLGDEG